MKILTWNINGVRAVQKEKASLKKILDSLEADVVCLQETKVTRDMLDEPTAVVDGFESYFSFSRKKTGYSGTANYCKNRVIPFKAEEGLAGKLLTERNDSHVCHYGNTDSFSEEELQAIDEEGRCVITQHRIQLPSKAEKEVAIINVYVPRAGDREDRHKYKLLFLTMLQIRAEALLRKGIHVIILGDINTTHRHLDNCDYQADEEFQRKSSRIWLNQLLQESERERTIPLTDGNLSDVFPSSIEGGHFSDVFRQLHPLQENAFTNWCTLTGARQTNFGRRLDYILVDTELANLAIHCEIMSEVEGSDHCPVILTLNCTPIPATSSPLLCSKFMPEFRGQQKKLSSFFTKGVKPSQSLSQKEPICVEDQSQTEREKPAQEKQSFSCSNLAKSKSMNGLKRNLSVESNGSGKKSKLKKGISDSKQSSLTSFFSQSNRTKKRDLQTGSEIDKNDKLSYHKTDTVKLRDDHTKGSNSTVEKGSVSQEKVTSINISCDSGDSDIHIIDFTDSKTGEEITETASSTKPEPSVNNHFISSPKSKTSSLSAWKGLLGGLPPPPPCSGHKEPSLLRTVKKSGPNKNKQFYVCARPDGAPGNPQSRCNFFQWMAKKK